MKTLNEIQFHTPSFVVSTQKNQWLQVTELKCVLIKIRLCKLNAVGDRFEKINSLQHMSSLLCDELRGLRTFNEDACAVCRLFI